MNYVLVRFVIESNLKYLWLYILCAYSEIIFTVSAQSYILLGNFLSGENFPLTISNILIAQFLTKTTLRNSLTIITQKITKLSLILAEIYNCYIYYLIIIIYPRLFFTLLENIITNYI